MLVLIVGNVDVYDMVVPCCRAGGFEGGVDAYYHINDMDISRRTLPYQLFVDSRHNDMCINERHT